MNKFPVQLCLESRWQPTARLLTPLATAGRVPAQEVRNLRNQTRPLHQRARNHPPARAPANSPYLPLTPRRTIHHHAPYTTLTTATPQPDPIIHSIFEPQTSTYQYIVADPATNAAVIIDPVLDYNPTTRTITTTSANTLLRLIRKHNYTISRILDTHAHADHLTAAFYLQRRLTVEQDGVKPLVGIGKRIGQVQTLFGKRYGIGSEEYEGVFDTLFGDDEVFEVGGLKGMAIHLPGHTPDHMGYRIGDNIFCGDSLFHPTLGTARCDFPGGSPSALYYSGRMLLSLPDNVRIWTGHDYPENGERAPEPWATVGEHRARNKHLRDGVTEREFVEARMGRDRELKAPRLVHESLQVNVRGGKLPEVDAGGMRSFKLPVKVEGEGW